MPSLNSCVLIGNLTADCELQYTPAGAAKATFTLAVNRKWKDKDGVLQDEATFIPIAVWGPQAEACSKYLKKGNPAAVEGRLSIRSYEKDGQKRSWTEIVANGVQFLGGKRDASGEEMHDNGNVPF